MRVLFTAFIPSHFMLMVPVAWALRAAGHDVVVAGLGDVVDAAATAGLCTARIGSDGGFSSHVRPGHLVKDAERTARSTGVAPAARTARELAEQRPWSEMGHWWRLRVHDVNGPLVEFARSWRPDLIVCETDHNGLIAGGLLDVPVVYHRWGPDLLSPLIVEHAREELHEPCVERGLADGMPEPDLIVDSCPPSLLFPDLPPAVPVRFVAYNGVGEAPAWARTPPPGRRIAVAMGMLGSQTLLPEWQQGLVAGLSEAIADLDAVEVLLPVGAGGAEALGPLPSAFRVIEPTPLNLYLGDCDLVINHGGAGTALTACALGVPQLVLPQPHAAPVGCAERIEARGAGLALPYDSVVSDPAALVAAVRALLDQDRYRDAAADVADEVAAVPAPDALVATLEKLAA